MTSPKKGKSKSKLRIKKNSKKTKSPTATVVKSSSRNLITALMKEQELRRKILISNSGNNNKT